MTIIDSLISGPENKRDIVLVILLWVIGYLVSVSLSVSSAALPGVQPVDIGQTKVKTSELTSRVPIPAGNFSIMLPNSVKIGLGEDARSIFVKLPPQYGFAGFAVSVEMSPQPYEVIRPELVKVRRKGFENRVKNGGMLLADPFEAKTIQSFEPVVSNGRPGFQARLKGNRVDKFYVELYQDTRRFMFEIAVSNGALTKDHRDLLYSVVNTAEDFKELKESL